MSDFREIYLHYSDKIFRFLYWHTGNSDQAEDLTSEVFLKAFKSWGKFKGDFVQAWLFRIARNLLTDFYRLKKPTRLDPDAQIEDKTDLVAEVEKEEREEKVRKALLELPENLRQVLILKFFENLSAGEIGKILDLSEGNVRILQFRALKKLREKIK